MDNKQASALAMIALILGGAGTYVVDDQNDMVYINTTLEDMGNAIEQTGTCLRMMEEMARTCECPQDIQDTVLGR